MARPALVARRTAAAALLALSVMAVALPAAARTPTHPAGLVVPPTVDVLLNDCALAGHGVPQTPTPDPLVTITLKHGKVTRFTGTVASSGGDWSLESCPVLVRAGDTLKVSANGRSRTITVPVQAIHIDPFTKRLIGRAPTTGSITVDLLTCQLLTNAACAQVVSGLQPPVSSAGTWSQDLSLSADWRPGFSDIAVLTWQAPTNDVFRVVQNQDHATVQAGSAKLRGSAIPGSKVKLTLTARGGAVRASATATASGIGGTWKATLRDAAGRPVKVRIGDTLKTNLLATKTRPGSSIKVHDLALTVLTDGVGPGLNANARCPGGKRFGLYLQDQASHDVYLEGIPDSTGLVSITDTTDTIPLGRTVEARCVSARFMDQIGYGETIAP
ncbi:MAG: hypothetical protein U0869_25985 [Chloroflexota bacterium]